MNRFLTLPFRRFTGRLCTALVLLTIAISFRVSANAQTDMAVYDDALAPGWQNWSWASVDLGSTAAVHSGSTAIAVTASPWSALSLWHPAFNTTGYGSLTFWINGGAVGGQLLRVIPTLDGNGASTGMNIGPLAANTWQQITIPLSAIGAADVPNFTGFWIQEVSNSGVDAPTYYVDDAVITGSVPVIPPPPLVGMAMYEDALVNGWENWSWAQVNFANTNPVNSGTSSIAVDSGPYTALRFHHSPVNTEPYTSLTFWISGGNVGGQTLRVTALLSDNAQVPVVIGPLAANTWQKISIPLADLGAANVADLTDIWFQEGQGATLPTYFVDDVRLDMAPAPSVVHVTVSPTQNLRIVDPRLFGLNTAIWDWSFNTQTTSDLLTEVNNRALRYPGGSASDEYHWQTNMSEGQTFQWGNGFDSFATIAKATNAKVFITVNYGTGTPAEAAAWVEYANRTKKLGVKYWELGNESYGTWEHDNNNRPHDPVTYATRFKDYVTQMKAVDHSIKVGVVMVTGEDSYPNYNDEVVTNPRTGIAHSGWTPVMLTTLKQLGCIPDFVVYHRYEQGPWGENDTYLLTAAKSWANDAAALRQLLNDYLGQAAKRVEISCTENNSVFGNPGKQTTSLVNGLFMADALGNVMKTEFSSYFWWDFRNGQEYANNNSPMLYGWRKYGDYGIVTSTVPAGPADRYPTFYVYKLLKQFARGGEMVVNMNSDYWGLGVYAVVGIDGLKILLINKHPTQPLTATLAIPCLKAKINATVYEYGMPEDDNARTGAGSADVHQSQTTLTGPNFTYTAGPYSATVLKIRPTDVQLNFGSH
jgi:hypothetical protein